MTRALLAVSAVLILLGGYLGLETLSFVRRAVPVPAQIQGDDAYKGPPRSARAGRLYVRFALPGAREIDTELAAPFLRKFKENDAVTLLVDSSRPQSPRWPYLSELWGRALSSIFVGIGMCVVTLAARAVKGTGEG